MIIPFFNKLAYYEGQEVSEQQFGTATDTPEKCRKLLMDAGFSRVEVYEEQMGFYLPDTSSYWQEVSSMIVRLRLERLSPEILKRFKEEHLSEVESRRTDKGIWIDVPILFSVAKK